MIRARMCRNELPCPSPARTLTRAFISDAKDSSRRSPFGDICFTLTYGWLIQVDADSVRESSTTAKPDILYDYVEVRTVVGVQCAVRS